MTAEFAGAVSQLPIALALAGAFLVVGFLVTRLAFRQSPVARFLCQLASFAGFTAMLLSAGVAPSEPTPKGDPVFAFFVISVFKIVWWFAASWLLSGFFRAVLVFKRQARETRFLQDLFVGVIYAAAGLAIVANVFDMPVAGVLAASGVVAIVLGLALQSTLGDVFSGIVLNLARPYHPGDWIILDGGTQGRVVETDWRATHILTPDNDLAIIPNSIIARAELINASQPMRAHGLTIVVRLEPTVAPSGGRAALQAALLSCNRILRAPIPTVVVRSLDAVAMEYEIQFFVSNVEEGPDAQTELFDLVFRHCASAGIRLAPPSGSPAPLPPRVALPDAADMPRRLLDHLPIFAPLSEAERIQLAPKMKRRTHKAGDVLVRQGSVAQALTILSAGVLVAIQSHGTGEEEAMRLAPGDSFGEAGLLAGAATMFTIRALTKATVYEIAKADLAPIFEQRPAIAAGLGEILARRVAAGKARIEGFADRDTPPETLATKLGQRVKDLFGLA
ncbi:cyclic nucleotide-regulated small mechanosensitive ion channel [Roseiarcus fermentans]|uniref:Small-conductance mechanosensitive channel n=1 Tax=Roseiarcus fermentans TaxID=1473586 RepID=A0A366FV16_9HYPH|nr:mechanosensitive ion channel family protein [Roseiarcus fermentans]RBP18351.1 cyclic nucleotide-regulated small mechanosensitive ion channel [Roseiarcus fermentans]